MTMAKQIEAVYQRALLLRQRATEFPAQEKLINDAINELNFVLEELHTSEEELRLQNHTLLMTRQLVEAERQRYQDLFNLAPDGYLVTDQMGIIQQANVAIALMFNRSQEALSGKPLSLFIADSARPIFYAMLDQINQQYSSEQVKTQHWETQVSPYQGESVAVSITLSMTCNPEGNGFNCLWLLHDITPQKRINFLLEQLNTELACQVEKRTAQLQQVLDFETSLKRIADHVHDSLDEHQILQVVVQELVQSLDVLDCEATFYDAETDTFTIRYQSHRSDDLAIADSPIETDSIIPIDVTPEGYSQMLQGQYLQLCEMKPTRFTTPRVILMCPIIDAQTVIGGLHLFKPSLDVFSDIEIRLVEQVANQCAIGIRQARLYQAAQAQVQELEQLHQVKDTFLSTVSHELRTPLSNINMAIHMLELSLKEPLSLEECHLRFDRYLKILRVECHQEITLINDLLDLSQIDGQKEPLPLNTFDLNFWLLNIIESFEVRIADQHQQLQINIEPNLQSLTTNASVFKRILAELLNNACKYTAPHETIRVTAHATDQTFQLTVSNSGVNLSAEELDHLFDRFYRVPSHDPWKSRGTGLGLALLRQKVEQLGGMVRVDNPESWLSFRVEIPWLPAPTSSR